ncbi:voltage-gated potassium channel [Stereum hirsutum FP-91666 SS1]|uniref:voltage-gated potassium channel n=1 Tax=Stereum hirsutum (strain FP-91666) TaxID=721885 RepID=UPI000444922D|nr:voltage-gated potassium channel [Stereum hirsutum FP-91666 SS1]EIM85100.1 voltage-gated potassium channel [Stereum hirsutum FP-91666 SS1]
MSSPIPLSSLSRASQPLRSHSHSPSAAESIEDIFPEHEPDRERDQSQPPSPRTVIYPPWKRDLLALLERPTSSSAAFVVHFTSTSLIVISALVTVLETVPSFHYISPATWFGLETSLVALFTIEYVARCVAWSYSWSSLAKWVGSFFGIIDLLAIAPFYIEIVLQEDTSVLFRFSILRTFRLLRVFRPFRYNNTLLMTIEVMYLSFHRSQHALLALGFFVVMVLVVFSTLLYFIERGTWDDTLEIFINSDGDPSQFASIPAAAWFVIVTITTVGYGEITPRSFLGRLITIPLLVFGLLLIALPSFVLGREFSLVWNEMTNGVGQLNSESPRLFAHPPSPLLTRQNSRSQPEPGGHVIDMDPTNINRLPANLPGLRDRSNGRRENGVENEMTAEIAELRKAVEMQGEMLRKLLERGAVSGASGNGQTSR